MELTLKREEHIEYIMNNFNFDKVHRIMKLLDWKWYCYSEYTASFGLNIPSILELKKTAKRLLQDVCEGGFDTSATGGFKATMKNDFIELEFIICERNSDNINCDNPNYETLKKQKVRKTKLNKLVNENN